MNFSRMEIKHRKCAVLHGQRTGNNWSKRDATAGTELTVQGSPLPSFPRDKAYTYLGHDINLSATSEEDQITKLINEFEETMDKIDVAPSQLVQNSKLSIPWQFQN